MRAILTVTFLVALLGFDIQAQKVDISKLEGIKSRAIGPAGMSGRVTSIDVVLQDTDIIYAGTASGGLWKSTSGGIDWKPIFDDQKVASVGAITIQQSNPDVIWVGTGEGNPRNSITGGYGVYKSLDAGKTWKLVGLEGTRNVHRIIIHKDDPNTVYVAAIGSPWGEHPERGVFRTKDGGNTWEKILFVDNKTGAADLVVDPVNPNKMIAAMWQHRRTPYNFKSGGPGSGIYITVDGGDNWKKLGEDDGLPKGDLGRVGLAIAPSKPSRVYALVESKKNAFYRSEDGGYSWKKINDKGEIGNRPFYYSDIYVDSKNENRIYSLFSIVNMSEDGGESWSTLLPYSHVHPDHHAWWIHPEDPNFIIDGNDGGLNITRDGGKTWRFIENLPVGQFYHVAVDMEFPYNVYGGMQDNGSWAGPAYVLKTQGIRNSYWQEVLFGDGFDVSPDPDDSRYGYAMSQGGNVARYDRVTGNSTTVRPTHPDPDMRLRFNWNAPLAQDPFDNATIYYGSQFVHKSTDKGRTWEIISPDLTTNDPNKQKQHMSGGLTIDATGAENYTTIVSIEPSSVQNGVIWAGTDDGNVQISRNGGASWQKITIPGMPTNGWVPQIRASKFDAGEAFVVVNNYRNFDFKPYLFYTSDYGATWRSLVNEQKVWGYCLSLVQDPVERNLLFLGTEYGLYFSIDGGSNWNHWTNDYPTVSTMDLVIHPREHDLVIGTFGRAFYVMDDIRPLRELASEGVGLLDKKLHLFQPPTGYQTETQQPAGTRFAADATFQGENRMRGAMISYYINREEKESAPVQQNTNRRRRGRNSPPAQMTDTTVKAKVDYDSITLEVYKNDGTRIRTRKWKTPEKDGLHRTAWFMDEKGVRRPSRGGGRGRFGGRGEPGGTFALPGEYTLVMSFGDQKDTTVLEVKMDPRLDINMNDVRAKYDMLKSLESDVELAASAARRLSESLKIVNDYESELKGKKGNEFKSGRDLVKSVKDSITSLQDEMFGRQSRGQASPRDPNPNLSRYLSNAYRYIRSGYHAPGETEERVYGHFGGELETMIDKVNEFYSTVWPEFRSEIEKLDLSPFKDYEPLQKN